MDLDGNGWFSSLVKAVTKVAEIVSWVPGPIGAIASGVAAVGYAIQGDWGAAARMAASAVTGGAAKYNGVRSRVVIERKTGRGAKGPTKSMSWRDIGKVWRYKRKNP